MESETSLWPRLMVSRLDGWSAACLSIIIFYKATLPHYKVIISHLLPVLSIVLLEDATYLWILMSVCWSASWCVRPVLACHNFLNGGKLHFHGPIRALVNISTSLVVIYGHSLAYTYCLWIPYIQMYIWFMEGCALCISSLFYIYIVNIYIHISL